MRLRNIPGAREEMSESEYVFTDDSLMKGKWKSDVFKNEKPLHVEIGMGKGRFITEHAKAEPEINFLGVEKYSSVLLKALKKQNELQLDNLRFVRMEAEDLFEAFEEREIDRIYLNFSDPWPKDRHAKRRLTSDRFLPQYEKILVKDGLIEFKTDNKDLFDFSLESIKEQGWELIDYTYDLHNDEERSKGNICTEYELKFSQKGNPICKLIARNPR